MKKITLFIVACFSCVGIVNAAVRDANTINRNSEKNPPVVVSRSSQNQRNDTKTINRSTRQRTQQNQNGISRSTINRTATNTVRSAVPRQSIQTNNAKKSDARNNKTVSNTRQNLQLSRAATVLSTTESNTFGTGYTACRDAYFTCMDQFCATQNDTYRRCVCSSRLNEIKQRENLLSQTATQLQDFEDFNISAIDKTSAEVTAMISASTGEALASTANDNSASAQQLKNISNILNKTKSQSLSTAGILDAGGDIQQIWTTTSLADGANIANLTGEALYNAVHSQCLAMVSQTCASNATLNMVVSAYGMYIENDCTAISNSLDNKITAAKGSIRETERDMHDARLDNYNAHNSVYINDCVANVRRDLTAKSACGPDFIHCLDVSGQYLYRETGEPIYSPQFYQLDGQISLSGDILSNQTNQLIIAELNRMRPFAANSLDKCRDMSTQVWEEFLRQAVAEIYQSQQERIRQVKNECVEVVNKCYDTQNQSLKDFSNIKEQLLLGQRLELSEELCQEKLDACSNLHGGGPNGLKELLVTMHEITDAKIGQNCKTALQDYTRDLCSPPSNDTLHSYPYACRVYTPGEQKYAQNPKCNQQIWDRYNQNNSLYIPSGSNTTIGGLELTAKIPELPSGYTCNAVKYTRCMPGYYLANDDGLCITINADNQKATCQKCPTGQTCPGGTSCYGDEELVNTTPPPDDELLSECGDYAGSMYQRLVRYALQTCVRPSDSTDPNYTISIDVLQDVNGAMDQIRVEMGQNLAKECERLGGLWIDSAWVDNMYKEIYNVQKEETTWGYVSDGKHDVTGDELLKIFYDETGANANWGYCSKQKQETTNQNQDN